MSASPASSPVRPEPLEPTPGVPPSLRQVTGFLLRRAHVRSLAELNQAMAAHERPRDLGILLLLAARGPLSQHELSCEWGINRTAMVKLVDRLEAAGYVLRERNPVNRRSYALQLTDEGGAATKRLLGSVLAAESRLTAALDAGQRDRLRVLLAALVDSPVPDGVEEVTTRTPFLVTRAHRAVREVGERLLAPLGIEPRHAGALTTIAGLQPCSQQQLADAIGISAPTALEVVGDLLERGLVTRERDPNDRRAYVVELTAVGSERLGQARQAFAGSRRHLVERLGVAGEEELRELLTVMLAGTRACAAGGRGRRPVVEQSERDLVEPEGVNAGAAEAVVDAEVGGGGRTSGGRTSDDVLGGGEASRAAEQQSNEEHPSPLGGSPWQDPDAPDEKAYSGDR